MKTTLIFMVSTIIFLNSCNAKNSYSEKEILAIKQSQEQELERLLPGDTLLNNIQQKIFNAFVEAKISRNDKQLLFLEQALLDMSAKTKNNIIIYWYSYTCYYHSIFYLTDNNNKKSEEFLKMGIKQLDDLKNKNSEHLALLALMKSISIQFAAGIEAPFISKSAKQNVENALQLDSLNLRAYYVLGSSDFYTPEQYGGGKKAEAYLKKAISLKDQSVLNPYLPSWGRNSAYELLIRFYIKKQQWNDAKKYYNDAIALFPDDYMINKLAGELVNH
jgi:hypothetical protein